MSKDFSFYVKYIKGYMNDKGFVIDENCGKHLVVMTEDDWLKLKSLLPFIQER